MKEKVALGKLHLDNAVDVVVDDSTDWVQSLLDELNENLDKDELASIEEDLFLKFEGTILKKDSPKFNQYALVDGNLSACFGTLCVQTGEPMADTLDFEVSAVVLADFCEEKFEFQDETSLYIDGKEWELYYHENNIFSLKEILHEFIHLNKNLPDIYNDIKSANITIILTK